MQKAIEYFDKKINRNVATLGTNYLFKVRDIPKVY